MKDNSLVTIITPSYNSESFIEEMIQAVLNQTYSNWELLITDDCSTDNTRSIIQNFAERDNRIKLYRLNTNSGAGVARNNSIKHASGHYMTFCDSDDLWEKDFLEKSMHFSRINNAPFVFSSYFRKNENLSKVYTSFIVPKKVNYKSVLKTCPISCLTAFINIDQLGKKYMPELKKRQDAALWLAYLKEIDYAYGIKEPLATYRMRENSLSRNKYKVIKYQWQLYRKSEKISFLKSIRLMAYWFYNGFMKYFNI
jgi:teichuronic acid biosynthesis glycosyltransferase TuaG